MSSPSKPPPKTASELHLPVDKDGKQLDTISTLQFLAVACVGGPIWAATVLPMGIIYQIGKAAVGALMGKAPPVFSNLDPGVAVPESEIVPRPKRKYDVVVLGATGFTGGLAVRHLAKTYGVNKKDVKWAIAGRNQKKLDLVKEKLAKELGMDEILQVDTIIVDTSMASTLPGLVRDTRAIITTAGPFSMYGSPVVEFCAKYGTHYADITGEVDWVKTVMEKWQETAKKTGAKIISACGCDCIPWDLTTYQLAKKLKEEKDEDLASVTIYNEFKGGVSGGTMATASLFVQGLMPKPPAKDPMRMTASGEEHKNEAMNKSPFLPTRYTAPWNGKSVCGTFSPLGPGNFDIVAWTQALRGGAPLSYSEASISPDTKTGSVQLFGFVAMITSLLNPITHHLMYKHVLPKPGEGPSMEDMANNFYLSLFAQGVGTKGSEVDAVIYYPRCAGYLETGRMLAECGLSLALEEEKLPAKGGGFYSPAYGLGDVLLKRLTDTGTYFAIMIKDEESK